jgi:hypothetical protein
MASKRCHSERWWPCPGCRAPSSAHVVDEFGLLPVGSLIACFGRVSVGRRQRSVGQAVAPARRPSANPELQLARVSMRAQRAATLWRQLVDLQP